MSATQPPLDICCVTAAWATGAPGVSPAGMVLGSCGGVVVVVVGGGVAVVSAVAVSSSSPPVLTMRCVSTSTACSTTGTSAGPASVMSTRGVAPVGVTTSATGSVVVDTVPVVTCSPAASVNVASTALTVTGTSATPVPAAFVTAMVQSAATPIVCAPSGAATAAVHGPRLTAASAVISCTAAFAPAGSLDRWDGAS
jgi:hypothetical protein